MPHFVAYLPSTSDMAIYHSLRTGMREAQLDEVVSAF
jgi:hypothetical protein